MSHYELEKSDSGIDKASFNSNHCDSDCLCNLYKTGKNLWKPCYAI